MGRVIAALHPAATGTTALASRRTDEAVRTKPLTNANGRSFDRSEARVQPIVEVGSLA